MSAKTWTWHPSEDTPQAQVLAPRWPKARRIGAWALSFAGIAVVATAAWWVTHSQIFQLRSLTVTGQTHLTQEEVAAAAGLDPSTNVLWLSPEGVERRLETHPWVVRVTVSRTLPTTLRVSVVERSAVAVVATPKRFLLADDGTVLEPVKGGRTSLPLVTVNAPDAAPGDRLEVGEPAMEVLAVVPEGLRARVDRIDVTTYGTVTLTLRDGVEVAFGDASRAALKSRSLGAVLWWAERADVRLAGINLVAPLAPAVRVGGNDGPTRSGIAAA